MSEPVEYYSLGAQAVDERALFGEVSRNLGDRWRVTAGGRWFGYGVATGNLTEFPYTPMYNSPYSDHESDDSGVLFKGSVSYRLDDETNVYFTRSEGYRIGGGNNFRVCTDEELALLGDPDPGNDPPQSGCIYADQALIRPDTTTNYEVGLRRSWADERVTFSGTVFHVDWTDIQVAGLTPFSAEPITLNGGGAVSRGVELASAAGVTNTLRLRGSWSYTRAELSVDSPGLLDGGADAFAGRQRANVLAPRRAGGASGRRPCADEKTPCAHGRDAGACRGRRDRGATPTAIRTCTASPAAPSRAALSRTPGHGNRWIDAAPRNDAVRQDTPLAGAAERRQKRSRRVALTTMARFSRKGPRGSRVSRSSV